MSCIISCFKSVGECMGETACCAKDCCVGSCCAMRPCLHAEVVRPCKTLHVLRKLPKEFRQAAALQAMNDLRKNTLGDKDEAPEPQAKLITTVTIGPTIGKFMRGSSTESQASSSTPSSTSSRSLDSPTAEDRNIAAEAGIEAFGCTLCTVFCMFHKYCTQLLPHAVYEQQKEYEKAQAEEFKARTEGSSLALRRRSVVGALAAVGVASPVHVAQLSPCESHEAEASPKGHAHAAPSRAALREKVVVRPAEAAVADTEWPPAMALPGAVPPAPTSQKME